MLAGLALMSALNLTGTLAWMVRQTTELEVNMNSGGRGALLSCLEGFGSYSHVGLPPLALQKLQL
jgi:hypothetical protein